MRTILLYTFLIICGAVLLFAPLFGCGASMVDFYRADATVSDAARTCYRVLGDMVEQRVHAAQAYITAGNKDEALALREKLILEHTRGRAVCDGLDRLATEGLKLGPELEKAPDRRSRIMAWIAHATAYVIEQTGVLTSLGLSLGK